MMREWGMQVSAQAVAEFYGDIISGFVYDERDAEAPDLGDLPLLLTDTLMKQADDRIRVAQAVLQFAQHQLEKIA